MKRTRKPVTLPTKASDLLELAVKDARAVAKRKGYRLDMGEWHMPNGVCRVCMAGAVMVNTLRVPRDLVMGPFDCDDVRTYYALSNINRLRMGWWPTEPVPAGANPAMMLIAVDYSERRDRGRAKWSTYLKAAKMLRAVGL